MKEIPKEWTFKTQQVAEQFDDHVREQLPWYDLMTQAVVHVAKHYIPRDGVVYDFGCSTGNIGVAISEVLSARNATLIGVDNSPEMEKLYRADGEFIVADMERVNLKRFDLAICFLSLMFLSPEKRQQFMQNARKHIRPGGAMIIVDKCEPSSGYASIVSWRLALAQKFQSGASPEQIIQKELSLSGVQRPIMRYEVDQIIQGVEIFRFGDFAAWIVPYEHQGNPV